MKKNSQTLILVLVLSLPLLNFSQETALLDTTKKVDSVENYFNVSRELTYHIREFKSNSDSYGLEKVYHGLEGVYYISLKQWLIDNNHRMVFTGEVPDSKFGIHILLKNGKYVIIINKDLVPSYLPTFINGILYHEMMHHIFSQSLLSGHCGGLDCPYITRTGDKINPETVINSWNLTEKMLYFQFITDMITVKVQQPPTPEIEEPKN